LYYQTLDEENLLNSDLMITNKKLINENGKFIEVEEEIKVNKDNIDEYIKFEIKKKLFGEDEIILKRFKK
jgi:hypothetical protein